MLNYNHKNVVKIFLKITKFEIRIAHNIKLNEHFIIFIRYIDLYCSCMEILFSTGHLNKTKDLAIIIKYFF